MGSADELRDQYQRPSIDCQANLGRRWFARRSDVVCQQDELATTASVAGAVMGAGGGGAGRVMVKVRWMCERFVRSLLGCARVGSAGFEDWEGGEDGCGSSVVACRLLVLVAGC